MSIIRCECVNLRHDTRCVNNAVWRCTTCKRCVCDKCSRQHHAHDDFEPLLIESLVVPQSAKELALEVVSAFDKGRRVVLTTQQAALLREHALIDMLGEPTARGRVAAGDIVAEQHKESGGNV